MSANDRVTVSPRPSPTTCAVWSASRRLRAETGAWASRTPRAIPGPGRALTALPPCAWVFASPAHGLAHRFGREATATAALALMAAGCARRALGGEVVPPLAGTLLGGVGIAIRGVVLPAIVKERFPAEQAPTSFPSSSARPWRAP